MNTPDCPFCKSKDSELYRRCEDFFLTREPFDLWSCAACGLIYIACPPSPEEAGRYYRSDEYYSHPGKKQGVISSLYGAIRNFMNRRKARMVAGACGKEYGRILDVGCGGGYFLDAMRRKGWAPKGYEQSADAAAYARTALGLDVLPGGEFFREQGLFDAITLWHVLEHLYNPDEYMRKIAGLLPPDGTLVLALPNPSSCDARHYGRYWAGYDVPRHLWHFTPEVITEYARRFGFGLVKTRPLFFDSYYCALLSEKYRGKRCRLPRALWWGTISNLNYLFRGRTRCSSVVYIFKKEAF